MSALGLPDGTLDAFGTLAGSPELGVGPQKLTDALRYHALMHAVCTFDLHSRVGPRAPDLPAPASPRQLPKPPYPPSFSSRRGKSGETFDLSTP